MKTFRCLLFTCLLFVASVSIQAQQKKYTAYAVGFYNLENLFDTQHDEGKNDYQYLPDGDNRWTDMKYQHKLKNMARVLSEMGTDKLPKVGCAFIGVSEVENANALTDLCNQEPLKERGYKFVHVEGPDRRGVDCALLYNPRLFTVSNVKLVPYVTENEEDADMRTRGYLTVSGTLAGEHVAVIVNHWPSRFRGSYYRELAGRQVRAVKDSLQAEDKNVKIFIMGDMNDDPMSPSMAEGLGAREEMSKTEDGGLWNPWWKVLSGGHGTLKYNGAWNLFDQIVLSSNLLDREGTKDYSGLTYFTHQIFSRDYLFQKTGKYKGNPLRTHAGGVWLDGYSDHLPVVVYLIKEKK